MSLKEALDEVAKSCEDFIGTKKQHDEIAVALAKLKVLLTPPPPPEDKPAGC